MGKRVTPVKASDREKKWDMIFNGLVKLSQNLQGERQILEERVKHLHIVINKMKMEQKVDSLKAELVLGLKEREAIVYKHRYDNSETELADFSEWCGYLAQKCLGPTGTSTDASNKGENTRHKALQDEVGKLKIEFEKYKLEKNSEISVLLAEKSFVWNQYNQMESNFTEQLRKKCDEVENAKEKVQILESKADELRISNERLSANCTKMESDSMQKNEEICKLRKEIEILKSRSGSASTLLRPCKADAPSSSRRGKSRSTTRGSIAKVKKESDPSQTSQTTERSIHSKPSAHKSTGGKAPRKQLSTKSTGGKTPRKQLSTKGSSSSKRKANDVIVIPDTPKLFTSSFKVPKLKN